jgi:glycosyltransferase involved in cell wall biosynthesis
MDFSIVIPTYNCAPYLDEALASVAAQEGPSKEVIVVDDGSTDDTPELLSSGACGQIRYLRLLVNHGGPSRPRNHGLRAARGEFIAFLDADDVMLPGYLAAVHRFFREGPELGMVFTRGERFNAHGVLGPTLERKAYPRFHRMQKTPAGFERYLIDSRQAFTTLFYENYILPSGVSIPRRIFDTVGFFDETLKNGDDRDLWFRITRLFPVGYIESPLFRYRKREGSISNRGIELAENRIRVMRKQLQQPLGKEEIAGARRILAGNLFDIGYHYQETGQYIQSFDYYLRSIREHKSLVAFKGLTLSLFCRMGLLCLNRK